MSINTDNFPKKSRKKKKVYRRPTPRKGSLDLSNFSLYLLQTRQRLMKADETPSVGEY
jgi:hypothetical protein